VQSWRAVFFGASDAAGTITVDKPPASIWAMRGHARAVRVGAVTVYDPAGLAVGHAEDET
jgi:hypothetical protein